MKTLSTARNRARKLELSRETLRNLQEVRTNKDAQPDTSCVESCYFVSCDGGCGISEGAQL